nr:hypothetical protein [Tanacetum cinerariifolium]
MKCKVDELMKNEISLMRRSENIFGMSSNMMRQLPPEPSRYEALKDLVMNFILDQEEKVRQLEKYMCIIGSDFMQLSLEVVKKLKEEIKVIKNKFTKIRKIRRKFKPTKLSTSHPSFEAYTPPATYPEEVEETIGIQMEVEPLDRMKLEDLGLNTCSHEIFLSSREIPSVDEPKSQLLPNFSPLDVNLGDKRGTDPPIKPHSSNIFRMKEVEKSTINTPPSPHIRYFNPKDTYCYYHPCIDDHKKHYRFKPSLLGQSRSLSVDFLNMEMIENDWELKSKEVFF